MRLGPGPELAGREGVEEIAHAVQEGLARVPP